jgi:DNA-directed RNA polymerase specialized sigma24 family protein
MDEAVRDADSVARSGGFVEARSRQQQALLRRAFEAGSDEYGGFPIEFETFARRATELTHKWLVRSGAPVDSEHFTSALERVAGADLFLASACDERIDGSWEVFTARFVPRMAALARRHGVREQEADDLAHSIAGDLAVPPPGGGARSRIGTYTGAIPLLQWLSVIVLRRLNDRFHAQRLAGEQARAATERRERSGTCDPIDVVLDVETSAKLERALSSAWKDLTPIETTALLFKFRDGLPQTRIALVLGVGEPQVSRILKSAVGRIRARIEQHDLALGREGSNDGEGLWNALRDAVARSLASSGISSVLPLDGRTSRGRRPS